MDKLVGGALGSAMGKDGIAEMAGKKVGQMVEGTVKNVMGGGGDGRKKEEEKAGGFGVGDLLGGGSKDKSEGGFGVGDALSLVSGGKEEGEGGVNVKKALGGLFK